jgi:phosphotriesterase-related protein
MTGKVMTVLGPIEPGELGVTLPHEHLFFDLRCWWDEPSEATKKSLAHASLDITNLGAVRRDPLVNLDNLVQFDIEVALEEATSFKRAGGRTIVDVTNIGISRDPVALRSIARQTGLNIIMGCGYYVEASHPPEVAGKSVHQIADMLTEEITVGVKRCGVKPGLIGEIGTSSPITPGEEKVLRAAAVASLRTGAPISVHPLPQRKEGLRILDILEEEGVNPERVIICHMNGTINDMDYHKAIAARGAFTEYDTFGMELYQDTFHSHFPSDIASISAVKEMMDAGYLGNILISHDVSFKVCLSRYGGWGISHILNHLPPYMRAAGITAEDLDTIMVENPARILPFVEPSSSH